MKSCINIIIKKILLFALKILYIFPVKNNRVVFISYNGKQFSCNPKYIFEYLSSQHDNILECVWIFDDIAGNMFSDNKIKVVRNNSLRFFYYMLTSKIIVSNSGIASYIPVRKKQYYIETWHGGGAYKKTGRVISKNKYEVLELQMQAKHINAFISSSRKVTETKSEEHMISKEKFWECGMPRNDVFFKKQPDLIKKVKGNYHIPEGANIVLYAPTFRGNTMAANFNTDIHVSTCIDALHRRFGGQWIMFVRAHYHINGGICLDNTVNVSDYDDMQELLCCADILISDYSSCMWDFSLTNKPCFVFAPDIAQYKQDRDFFTPTSEWPYTIAANNDELENNILEFNGPDYQTKVKVHHNKQGNFDTGHATEYVANRILEITLKGGE